MEKVAKLLFELASVERLDVLSAISSKTLKLSEISKKFDMTASETSRHLERLMAAKLVAKNNNGEYGPSSYSRVLLSSLPFFNFLTENQEYLSNHDLTVLPTDFLGRLGDLAGSTRVTGVYKIMDSIMQTLRNAKRRVWILVDQTFLEGDALCYEKAAEGADVRCIFPKRVWPPEYLQSPVKSKVRGLENVSFALGVYDDVSRIIFPRLNGEIDNSICLVLQTPSAYRWAEELFLHFWNQAEKLPYEFIGPARDR